MDYTEKTLKREEQYIGKILSVHRDTVRLPDGAEAVREVVEHSGGVGVLPVDEEGNVWMVRQFRYAFGQHLLDFCCYLLLNGRSSSLSIYQCHICLNLGLQM